MDKNEFVGQYHYIEQLKKENLSPDRETTKGKEFNTIMCSYLQCQSGLFVRDFLDVDNTFAVAVTYSGSMKTHVDIYQSIIDILETTMYSKVKKIGLIDIDGLNGFWVLLG